MFFKKFDEVCRLVKAHGIGKLFNRNIGCGQLSFAF